MNLPGFALASAFVLFACSSPTQSNDGGNTSDGIDGTVSDVVGSSDISDTASDAAPSDCPIYQARCNGVCIPVAVDPDNCGGCGVVCSASQVCASGACSSACGSGLTACSRQCVDINSDNANCGACGHACGAGTGCSGGTCVPAIAVNPGGIDCTGGGPPIELGGFPGGGTRCAGDVAEITFRWALCSCTDITLAGPLLADGFDSSHGPYHPGDLGGGVGANGRFSTSSESDVWGTLWTASTGGLSSGGRTDAHHELHANGSVSQLGMLTVGHDAFVNGNVVAATSSSIGGDLHVPAGAIVSPGVTYGSLVHGPVSVPNPCDCAPSEILPIAAIVADASTHNDNARIGLDPAALDISTPASRLDLPCGRYYLNRIASGQPVTIVAHGHTALFIGGNVADSARLTITLDPTASLDVFIAGTVSAASSVTFGSVNYPALMRVYIGSTDGFSVSATTSIAGNFYVPNGPVATSARLEAFGSIFAGNFSAADSVSIHFDRLVLRVGETCHMPEPQPDAGGMPCTSCRDCANQACLGGSCGPCTSSADCCAPLVCAGGVCVVTPD